jgi:hypothetical protein
VNILEAIIASDERELFLTPLQWMRLRLLLDDKLQWWPQIDPSKLPPGALGVFAGKIIYPVRGPSFPGINDSEVA